ncbi:MAG: hypothetical protein WCT26_00515 [Candidatus Buchananbacteria bacterium]|jgi:predicted RNase H-like nuclease (RuvC/YqgF family)
MEKMEGSSVKEMIEVRREDSEQLEQQISKLQRRIDENNDDIKTLQSRCPHEWGIWRFVNQEYDMNLEAIVDIHIRTCSYCGKKKLRKQKAVRS